MATSKKDAVQMTARLAQSLVHLAAAYGPPPLSPVTGARPTGLVEAAATAPAKVQRKGGS